MELFENTEGIECTEDEQSISFFQNYTLPAGKLPVFYCDDYNISFFGLEKIHPFDSEKYRRVYNYLVSENVITGESVVPPFRPDQEMLESFHTPRYLDSLKASLNLADILEIWPVVSLPWRITYKKILKPLLYASGGTVMAAKSAIETGWSINLGGGFHHASRDAGGGFCAFADNTMAIKIVLESVGHIKNVLYVDLDVHQGNGVARDFMGDQSVHVFDAYNTMIYPGDEEAKQGIGTAVEFGFNVADEEYLTKVEEALEDLMQKKNFDFIFYNSGSDILDGDPLGGLKVSAEGIQQRDEYVFKMALDKNIPIAMVLSGGYLKKSPRVIADSIKNLFSACCLL